VISVESVLVRWVLYSTLHTVLILFSVQDGRTYVHCGDCKRCVKPTYTHCKLCQRCKLPEHKCVDGGVVVAKDKENIKKVVVEEKKFVGKRKSRKRNRHKREKIPKKC
jgi:hypothetical protein